MESVTAAAYELFAPFYDAVNGEPEELSKEILASLRAHAPAASRVLELGCGTGAILAGLGSGYAVTGIDFSPAMIDVARRRVPGGEFHIADITNFTLGATFDVVLCVLDTLNHVTTVEGWRSVFELAASHLVPGGLFIVDINTIGRVTALHDVAPWVHDFDGHTLLMALTYEPPLAHWDIRLFEHVGGQQYQLRGARITERMVSVAEMGDLIPDSFRVIATSNLDGGAANDESPRALFTLRRV